MSAILASADGWTQLTVRAAPADMPTIDLRVSTRFWERGVELSQAGLVEDAEARVSAVAFDTANAEGLAADLGAWVALPLGELAARGLQGEYELPPEPGMR